MEEVRQTGGDLPFSKCFRHMVSFLEVALQYLLSDRQVVIMRRRRRQTLFLDGPCLLTMHHEMAANYFFEGKLACYHEEYYNSKRPRISFKIVGAALDNFRSLEMNITELSSGLFTRMKDFYFVKFEDLRKVKYPAVSLAFGHYYAVDAQVPENDAEVMKVVNRMSKVDQDVSYIVLIEVSSILQPLVSAEGTEIIRFKIL